MSPLPWHCQVCDKPYKIVMGRGNDEVCRACQQKEQYDLNLKRGASVRALRKDGKPDKRETERD